MQTTQTANELIIRETPGCLWIFGLFFALVGGVFVYGALGGLADYQRHAAWMLVLAFVMGSIAIAAGIRIIYRAPITRVVVDRLEETVSMTRFGLFGKQETSYAFDEIEQFCLIEELDDESNPIWFLGMNFQSGEIVKISSLPSHDRRFKQGFVFQTNEFMGKGIISAQMILELEDEPDAEIS
jgi:hypothetical protein